jgi:NhaA family Na+:H+ antiporter
MTTVLTKLFREFFESEKTGGFVLLGCTVLSLVLANSGVGEGYIAFWNAQAGGHTIVEWINDALMAVFFLLIGLELEREIYQGELSDLGSASLPIIAAVGGMLVPAGIHLALNAGTATQSGAGIPMATDIAFAIGILSLLGNRVPASLKVFLTALAVIDDLGAIIIIAVAYSGGIQFSSLLIALGIFAVLLVLNRLRVYKLVPYLAGGVVMWYFMLQSGVHATITGVLLAFAIPFGNGGEKSPSYILQHILHKPVAFFILPVFALANTCIPIAGNVVAGLLQSNSIGIMAGLLIGKPAGISLFSFLAVRMRLATLPDELKWNYIAGTGLLGGIGFTMSIFIALLAFDDGELINGSKIAVLVGSLLAGGIGYVLLNLVLPKNGEVDS